MTDCMPTASSAVASTSASVRLPNDSSICARNATEVFGVLASTLSVLISSSRRCTDQKSRASSNAVRTAAMSRSSSALKPG